ncbi:MAG TPA: S-methyl-5-thioribose-1-phosphate isomerase, partial [Bacteroidota bacterium]
MKTIEWQRGAVRFLDQTRLPQEEVYVVTRDAGVIAEAIRALRIRGAPAIGVAAAYGVALAAAGEPRAGAEQRTCTAETIRLLRGTRPTAVNLFKALDRMERTLQSCRADDELAAALLKEAHSIHREDIEACRRIGELGAALLRPGTSVLTHCNAGALATTGIGTALGVIVAAHRQGKIRRVYAGETRPLLQ